MPTKIAKTIINAENLPVEDATTAIKRKNKQELQLLAYLAKQLHMFLKLSLIINFIIVLT